MAHLSVRIMKLTVVTIISSMILFSGCREKAQKTTPVVSEGVVNYTISYTPEIEAKSFSFLLPEKMHYYFQPGNERISFRGDMGIYTLDFISNHGTNNSSTLLKIINKKMYVPPSESDNLFIFQQLKEGKVFLDKDTVRTILGYEARKATIQLKNGQSEIVVWYTPELASPTTNKNTPFAGIPGVMLEFSISYRDVLFYLKPESIIGDTLSESVFQVPGDYQRTSIEEIEQTIASILTR
jgi:hypothetical protein